MDLDRTAQAFSLQPEDEPRGHPLGDEVPPLAAPGQLHRQGEANRADRDSEVGPAARGTSMETTGRESLLMNQA
jgi:hypothetical protein